MDNRKQVLDLKTGEITQDVREENLRIFKESLDMVTNLNNWHAFMNLFASAGYLKGSLVASSNAVVSAYVLYLIGKYEYKVSSVELQKIIRKWIFYVYDYWILYGIYRIRG